MDQLIKSGGLMSPEFVAERICNAVFDPNPIPHLVMNQIILYINYKKKAGG